MLQEFHKRPTDFTRYVIANGSEIEIRELEAKILSLLDVAHNKNFYNMHNGDGKFYNKGGYKLGPKTEEHKLKLSLSHKGLLKGKKQTKEHIEKRIETKKKLGIHHSEETKKKISEFRKSDKNPAFLRCWITNGIDNKFILKDKQLLKGWKYGRNRDKDSAGRFQKKTYTIP